MHMLKCVDNIKATTSCRGYGRVQAFFDGGNDSNLQKELGICAKTCKIINICTIWLPPFVTIC